MELQDIWWKCKNQNDIKKKIEDIVNTDKDHKYKLLLNKKEANDNDNN